jgi:hypothetical protein
MRKVENNHLTILIMTLCLEYSVLPLLSSCMYINIYIHITQNYAYNADDLFVPNILDPSAWFIRKFAPPSHKFTHPEQC